MSNLYIAVCEDNNAEQQHLRSILEKSDHPVEIKVYSSGEDLLGEYKPGSFDLILMDIYLSGLSGIKTITELRKIDEQVMVAFTTSSLDHTLESYRLEALKYIEKPVKEKAVQELLDLARIRKENKPRLTLKKAGQNITVPLELIMYAEQNSHALFLFLSTGEVINILERLDHIEEQFSGDAFFRCHKSFLVNFAFVEKLDIELRIFRMKEGNTVHIRRESMAKAKKSFENYLFNHSRRTEHD